MTDQKPTIGLEKDPAPAWARTVTERRLIWLRKRHPKMDPRKRLQWAISRAQGEGTADRSTTTS